MAIFKKKQPAEKDLTAEIGVDGSVVFEGFDQEESRIDKVKIEAYRKMVDEDPTVSALVSLFKMGILSTPYHIEADADDTDEAQAEFVRRNLLEPPHKGGMQTPIGLFLDQALQAVYEGYALFEKIYELCDGKYHIKRLAKRDSTTLTLIRDDEGGFGGAKQSAAKSNGTTIDVVIPAEKCFLFTYDKGRSYLYGRSALKPLYKAYEKKRRLEYLDSIALQADAIKPKILKRTVEGIADAGVRKARAKALSMLSRLGERKPVGAIPYGYEIEVLNTEGRDPHQSIERQNSEMARAFHANVILTATQGSASNVGSYSLSSNQKDLLHTAIESVMKLLAEHINQYLIADLIDLNFADRHYPELKFAAPDEATIGAVFDAFKTLAQKDRVSDEMAIGIEQQVAARLDIDLEALKQRVAESKNENGNNDDEGGSGGDAGKFLGEEEPAEAVNTPVNPARTLTAAESRVKFDSVTSWIDQQEADFESKATDELTAAVADIDISRPFALPASYVKLLQSRYKTAYNYGKLTAADEQKLPAPQLKAELKERQWRFVDFVTTKQTDDVQAIIDAEKLKLPLSLADEDDERQSFIAEAVKVALAAWIIQAVRGTKGSIVSQGFSNGRDDSFRVFDRDDPNALYQWSSVMEANTCPVCASLDGRTITAKEKATTPHNPQKHINCRCIWVRIPSNSGDYGQIEITGIDNRHTQSLEVLHSTPKKQLIDSGVIPTGVNKADIESLLMYQGAYYGEINRHFRLGAPVSNGASSASERIDKLLSRHSMGYDEVAYRGVGLKKPLSVGDIADNPGFFSASRDKMVARSFAYTSDDKYKYLLKVKIPAGYSAIDMNAILQKQSVMPHEKEVLLPRGQRYIIKGMGKPDKNHIVDVDIALVDSSGKELSDTASPKVIITKEQVAAADALIGEEFGEFDPDSEEAMRIYAKMRSHNEGLVFNSQKSEE